MFPRRLALFCLLAALAMPVAAVACMWDYDTLQMERSRFPSILELITGKFLRHSTEFYRWRIDDRLRKLKTDPDNLGYYDDLAVAYEKTGQLDKAIETIRIKDKKRPGLYETEANLGTFLMLDGRFEEGLQHIDAALRINPEAHFGREKYQKKLAEDVIRRKKDGKVPQPLVGLHDPHSASFRSFLIIPGTKTSSPIIDENDRKEAVKAVLGMMRFAHYDSPLLLEVLGDLLRNEHGYLQNGLDEKQLAARAYLKASYETKDDVARGIYRQKSENALVLQSKYRVGAGEEQLSLSEVESAFRQELRQTEDWFAQIRKNETSWIQAGEDPEAEFARAYYADPRVDADESDELPDVALYRRRDVQIFAVVNTLFWGPPILLIGMWWRWRRSRIGNSKALQNPPPN